MESQLELTLDGILAIYEELRGIMPTPRPGAGQRAKRLRDIADQFDALFLDGFGVLNIGLDPIEGAIDLVAMAAEQRLPVLVVTNAATGDRAGIGMKYQTMGFGIEANQVISSREALQDWLKNRRPEHWQRVGVADSAAMDLEPSGLDLERLAPDAPDRWHDCDAIALMGASRWDTAWDTALASVAPTKPLLIANPDVAAPHPGRFSREPGFIAARLRRRFGMDIRWFGKPHKPHFELAISRLEALTGRPVLHRERIAMVGDSLHTDILGGAAAGLTTVLVTGHGMFRAGGADAAIARTGITPDYIVDTV